MLVIKNSLSRLIIGGALVSLGACGGGMDTTSPSGSGAVSAARAQVIASALFAEMSKAMATATISKSVASLATAGMPSQNYTVNSPCTSGGTITGSYVYSTDLNSAGTGTVSGAMTTTAHDCKVNDGTGLIATNGSLNYSYSVSYTAFQPSSNFVWKAKGDLTWTGGSCTMDYTVSVSTTGHGTISGNVCGQSVNQTI